MDVLVIDGQGGGVGKSIIEELKANFKDISIIGVGTNGVATNSLKKGGADIIATGENAVIYNSSNADIIIGPIGISFSNSMYGEISPAMALGVNESKAKKYLIPISNCNAKVIGTVDKNIPDYIKDLIDVLKKDGLK